MVANLLMFFLFHESEWNTKEILPLKLNVETGLHVAARWFDSFSFIKAPPVFLEFHFSRLFCCLQSGVEPRVPPTHLWCLLIWRRHEKLFLLWSWLDSFIIICHKNGHRKFQVEGKPASTLPLALPINLSEANCPLLFLFIQFNCLINYYRYLDQRHIKWFSHGKRAGYVSRSILIVGQPSDRNPRDTFYFSMRLALDFLIRLRSL